MDEDEQNRYVAQLRREFDNCDTTGTGYLDRDELITLCDKLQLGGYVALLLDTLLGSHRYARVNFEEFKEGFVAVLSRSAELSTSEEESSYLEPAIPEEVKPKFVKGTKRYGRRSRPDRADAVVTCDSEETQPRQAGEKEALNTGGPKAKLCRSTSLDSVESLKSDEEAGNTKDPRKLTFEAKGQLKRWKQKHAGSPRRVLGQSYGQARAVWAELGVGSAGYLSIHELSMVCDSIGLKDLQPEELEALFNKLDKDQDGKVSLQEFHRGFFSQRSFPEPTYCSTPMHANPSRSMTQVFEGSPVRSTSPSHLPNTVGQRLLTRLDDGSGCASPEQVIALWSEEGIRNSKHILQTLDFCLDEPLSLVELSVALDNELLASENGIHQAALVSYKNEIQFLLVQAEHACRERDKAKADLDKAEQRNMQLIREVDDRQNGIEMLNQSKIRDLEQEYRERLSTLRGELERESDLLTQQAERERTRVQEEVEGLKVQEVELRDEVTAAAQENSRLERELSLLKEKLSESQANVTKLQRDLDQVLLDKFGSLDSSHTGLLSQEERFCEIVKQYELQCRELRDRNDELSSELEMLKTRRVSRKARRARNSAAAHTWSSGTPAAASESESDLEVKSPSPIIRKKLQVADKNGLASLESLPGTMSIEAELAVEQLKEKHSQEVQDLKIQLETKVNFYERSLELMRHNMEVECKDISQSFKMEISELEEQKAHAEERAGRLQGTVTELRAQLQAAAWGPEQERRMQRERAELEQNFAREISNLVQRLTSEKDQLEAEMRLKADEEVHLVRVEAERKLAQIKESLEASIRSMKADLSFKEHKMKDPVQDKESAIKEHDALVQEMEMIQHNCRQLSDAFIKQQILLQSKEEELDLLRIELEETCKALADTAAKLESVEESVVKLKKQEAASQLLQAQMNSRDKSLECGRRREQSLKEALKREEIKVMQIQTRLDLDREEREQLLQENVRYARLVHQLSCKIVEMEAEFRGDHQDLKVNFNPGEHEGLVENVEEVIGGGISSSFLQQALTEAQAARWAEELEKEKNKMKEQLLDMERLVLAVEEAMEQENPHRARLEEVDAENAALKSKQATMQRELQMLQDEVRRRKNQLEEFEKEHEKGREDTERLYKENAKHREEALDLSSRNLQLSSENAELSARLRTELGVVQRLSERVEQLSRQQQDEAEEGRRIRQAAGQKELQLVELRAGWQLEKERMERELQGDQEKLKRLSEVESELKNSMFKQQWLEGERQRLLKEVEEKTQKVERMQESLHSLNVQMEQLQSQLQTATLDKGLRAQEVSSNQRMLQEAKDKVRELEVNVAYLLREKEQLKASQQHEKRETQVLQKEYNNLLSQNQELLYKVGQLQLHEAEVQRLNQECVMMRSRQTQLEASILDVQEQRLKADTTLVLVQSQHEREVQEQRDRASQGSSELLGKLQGQLAEEQQKRKLLEERLHSQAQQASTQMSLQQENYEKTVKGMEEKMEEVETKLNSVRMLLQEKVNQLKEQLSKNAKSDLLLKDLYVESAQLMKALQVTEQRQKSAEKKNLLLEEKITALNMLLRRIAPASLTV